MASYGLDEWFWAMFEPTWTWPNFTFGQKMSQLFMWIDLISLLVNFSCELGQIMTGYDFLWTRRVILFNSNFVCELRQIMTRYDFLLPKRVILSNIQTDSQLNLILLVNISCELGQIMTRYDLLRARWVILSSVQTDCNLT